MKRLWKKIKNKEEGSIVVATMLVVFFAAAIAGAYLKYTIHEASLTRRMLDFQRARLVAEVGLEYGVQRLKNVLLENQFRLSQTAMQTKINLISPPPNMAGYAYRTPGNSADAFRITVDTPVQMDHVITNGSMCVGLWGDNQVYTISCGAVNTNNFEGGAVLRMTVHGLGVFLIRFAIFYEDDCEFFPGRPMDVHGPVHVNCPLYIGSDSSLNFHDRVTSTHEIILGTKDGRSVSKNVWVEDSNDVPIKMDIDSKSPNWVAEAYENWDGNVLSGDHGVQHLSPPIGETNTPLDIIQRTRTTNCAEFTSASPSEQANWIMTEEVKYANKACLVIHVDSNNNVNVMNGSGMAMTNMTTAILVTNSYHSGRPVYEKQNGMYVVTGVVDTTQQYFYDSRESTYMAPIDIYVDQLEDYLTANNGELTDGDFGLVYVTRDTPASDPSRMPCVRVRNGKNLNLPLGLSVVSDMPMYVEGDYNILTTNIPAMVAGDAVTMLSENWKDAYSMEGINNRVAQNTDVRVVVMNGNTETWEGLGSAGYNGGVENVLRFLEKWNGKTYWFRGSIIDLWYSQHATNRWSYGSYYTAPNRNWGYDQSLRRINPPGMTQVFGMEELSWSASTWSHESF